MKTKHSFIGYIASLLLVFSHTAWPDIAICKIEIEDIHKGTTHTLEHQFKFKKGGDSQRKYFGVTEYFCTLVFFELKEGTLISCEYLKDMGHTFFQSDRSALKDEFITNNLTFRHKSAFISLKTKCAPG